MSTMSEDPLSRPTSVHSSGGVSSSEDLSQKYQKLFQEYSRIKAQHSVLKKAVIKEQATNSNLQGEVKSKEQQLRKVQEELDLLTFHNDRLTKRIESLQEDGSGKGSFSLLGGALKKDLDKSKMALEVANLDLQAKIDENERLHKKIFEVNSQHTQRLNELNAKIQPLENRLAEAEVEVVKARGENEEILAEIKKEKALLEAELAKANHELQSTLKLVGNNEKILKEHDSKLQQEIQVLRSVLLLKLEDVENVNIDYHDLPDDTHTAIETFAKGSTNLTRRLRELEGQLQKNEDERAVLQKSLDKETTRANAFQTEIRILNDKLREKESDILAKQHELAARQAELESRPSSDQPVSNGDIHHSKRVEELVAEIEDLSQTIAELEDQIRVQEAELAARPKVETTLDSNSPAKENISDQEDDSDGSFVYPSKEGAEVPQSPVKQTQDDDDDDDDDDDEGFVYAGNDAPLPLAVGDTNAAKYEDTNGDANAAKDEDTKPHEIVKNNVEEVYTANDNARTPNGVKDKKDTKENETKELQPSAETKPASSAPPEEPTAPQLRMVSKQSKRISLSATEHTRENLIKNHYEAKIHQLTEQLQLCDGKSIRYSKAMQVVKDKLAASEREKEDLRQEIAELNRNVVKLQDELTTTETVYKKQLEIMTEEYVTQMQSPQQSQQQ